MTPHMAGSREIFMPKMENLLFLCLANLPTTLLFTTRKHFVDIFVKVVKSNLRDVLSCERVIVP